MRFFILLFLRFVFLFLPPLFLGRTFFVPAKAGLTYELLQTIYHRPFKTQKTVSGIVFCLFCYAKRPVAAAKGQNDPLGSRRGKYPSCRSLSLQGPPSVFWGYRIPRGRGYRMKQIILWVLSKIYYTICNRKAQVFLRILYIIPHNIRVQKNRHKADTFICKERRRS